MMIARNDPEFRVQRLWLSEENGQRGFAQSFKLAWGSTGDHDVRCGHLPKWLKKADNVEGMQDAIDRNLHEGIEPDQVEFQGLSYERVDLQRVNGEIPLLRKRGR